LHGTEAILAHLAEPRSTVKWLPIQGIDFARVMQWLIFSAHDLGVTIAARQHSLFDTPGERPSLRAASSRAHSCHGRSYEARGFAQAEWFAADHATIADIALFPAFALSRDFGIDHDEYPAAAPLGAAFSSTAWLRRCRAFGLPLKRREFRQPHKDRTWCLSPLFGEILSTMTRQLAAVASGRADPIW